MQDVYEWVFGADSKSGRIFGSHPLWVNAGRGRGGEGDFVKWPISPCKMSRNISFGVLIPNLEVYWGCKQKGGGTR